MDVLSAKATSRLHDAFRPKTKKAYSMMFRAFMAFCIIMNVQLVKISVKVLLSFLECLASNQCSATMVANYISAIKANLTLYHLNFSICDHPNVKYFIRSLRINRPLSVVYHNIIDIPMLKRISRLALTFKQGRIYKAIFLTGFFAFLRLSNLCPHSLATFDPSRHLTGADLIFTKSFVKVILKWSKTIQTRDSVQVITLPRLTDQDLCPRAALKYLKKYYSFTDQSPLFQSYGSGGWSPLIDSRVRKVLKAINKKLGLNPSHFTFHSFRRSGATFAFNSHIPVRNIQRHGTWTSDCVWRYIQADQSYGEHLVSALACSINS